MSTAKDFQTLHTIYKSIAITNKTDAVVFHAKRRRICCAVGWVSRNSLITLCILILPNMHSSLLFFFACFQGVTVHLLLSVGYMCGGNECVRTGEKYRFMTFYLDIHRWKFLCCSFELFNSKLMCWSCVVGGFMLEVSTFTRFL